MRTKLMWLTCMAAIAALQLVPNAEAAEKFGMKKGTPKLKSAEQLAFSPEGILFIGDTRAATIYAVDVADKKGESSGKAINVARVNEKIAEALGASPADISINDLAVNPASGNVYFSVTRKGEKSQPAIARVNGAGKLAAFPLKDISYAKAELPNPPVDKVVTTGRRPKNPRDESITDLAYVDGKVLVSGLTAGEASSSVRELDFPFVGERRVTNVEIYHGAHGRFEDDSPIRVFIPFNIGGEPSLLAGFTCTPLVKFPVKSLQAGEKVRGTTIAELGNRNRPLDMIAYEKGGAKFLLMANSARGVMKVSTKDIENQEAITERVGGGGTAGQPYETIKSLENVVQLDQLNDGQAVILVQSDTGTADLKTIDLP